MGGDHLDVSHTLYFPKPVEVDPSENTALVEWAAKRIPWVVHTSGMRAVAVVDGPDMSCPILAVALYHTYLPPKKVYGETWYNTVEMSFAAVSPRFATRQTIIDLLKIPFNQFKVDHVLVAIPSINKRAIRFVTGIGFTPRGTLSRFYSKSVYACVFGLHRNTFKSRDFLKRKRPLATRRPQPHGQEHPVSAPNA